MIHFLNTKIDSFGLDISNTSLRLAKIERKKGRLTLVSFGKKELDSGIIDKGKIKNEELLALAIKDLVKKVKGEKIKTKYVAVALPEEKSFLQIIEMPEMDKEKLGKAVIFEAENYIPLPIDEVYLDFQIISSNSEKKDKKRLNVLVSASPKKIVDSYVSSIEKAGLSPVFLEMESMSTARSVIKKEKNIKSLLLVDIGETKTNFIIFSKNSVQFTSSDSISSGDFTKKISEHNKISLMEAEKLKIKHGINNEKRIDIYDISKSFLEEMLKAIKKHLSYYESCSFGWQSEDKNIDKIIVCGGGANLKGLPEFLSKNLNIEIELGNPFVNFSKPSQEFFDINALSYGVTFGLALHSFEI